MKLKQTLLMPLSFLFATLILLAYYQMAVLFVKNKSLKMFPYERLYSFSSNVEVRTKDVLPYTRGEVFILNQGVVEVLNPKFDFKLARMDRPELEWITKLGKEPIDRVLKAVDPYYSTEYDYIRKADEETVLKGTWYAVNPDWIKPLDEKLAKAQEAEIKTFVKAYLDSGQWTQKEADAYMASYQQHPVRFLNGEIHEEKKQIDLTDFLVHLWKSGEGSEDVKGLLFLSLNYILIYHFGLSRRRQDLEVHLQFASYRHVFQSSFISFLKSIAPSLIFFSLLAWCSVIFFALPLSLSIFTILFTLLLICQSIFFSLAYVLAIPVKRYRKEV